MIIFLHYLPKRKIFKFAKNILGFVLVWKNQELFFNKIFYITPIYILFRKSTDIPKNKSFFYLKSTKDQKIKVIFAKNRPRTPKKMLSYIKIILFIDNYITLHYFFLITEFNYLIIHDQENFNQFFVFTVYISNDIQFVFIFYYSCTQIKAVSH